MLRIKLIFIGLFSYAAFAEGADIGTIGYLLFSPEKSSIDKAVVRHPPITIDTSNYKHDFFMIDFSKNPSKEALINGTKKQYYQFLLDPYQVKKHNVKANKLSNAPDSSDLQPEN